MLYWMEHQVPCLQSVDTSGKIAPHSQRKIVQTCGKEEEPSSSSLKDSMPTKLFDDHQDYSWSCQSHPLADQNLFQCSQHACQYIQHQSVAIEIHKLDLDHLPPCVPSQHCQDILLKHCHPRYEYLSLVEPLHLLNHWRTTGVLRQHHAKIPSVKEHMSLHRSVIDKYGNINIKLFCLDSWCLITDRERP